VVLRVWAGEAVEQFRVFEFDVLVQAALGAIGSAALGGLAGVLLLDFICSSPAALLPLGCFLPHLVLKLLLCFFLSEWESTSKANSLLQSCSLLSTSCLIS
jgi:hypothetical protein